eukprot:GGOE01025469.1.p4 GENE.GGOE01025469.1~~GGOE01025469.1.p4  ORF type:complete len:118 (+),score=32.08 GGOE01025469.1:40-354(+)
MAARNLLIALVLAVCLVPPMLAVSPECKAITSPPWLVRLFAHRTPEEYSERSVEAYHRCCGEDTDTCKCPLANHDVPVLHDSYEHHMSRWCRAMEHNQCVGESQ